MCYLKKTIPAVYMESIVCFRMSENGVETVTVEEDGVLKSKTVNGQPQAIEY